MTEVNSTRPCNKCSTVTDQYYKSNPATCKECIKAGVRRNRAKNIEYYREYDSNRAMLPHRVEMRKIYSQTDAGKEAHAKACRKERANNPQAYKAKTAVNNAVRDGRLDKPDSCSVCGDKHDWIHGHHDDYSKPLDVRWLCPPCHKEAHSF